MDIHKLSDEYTVRRMTEADIDSILDFCLPHTLFYSVCGQKLTREDILNDLALTPPGIELKDKYYVGFFDEDGLAAVLDLIDGYPKKGEAFIGFFMVACRLEGRGVGSRIIDRVLSYLRQQGFTACHLGIDKENPQSNRFWRKNGFAVEREVQQERGVILYASRCF